MTEVDLAAAFHKLSRSGPWVERLAILDDGPTVRIVDRCAEHAGRFGRLRAIIPHDDSEANDEVVLVLQDAGEVVLYRDQSGVPLAASPVASQT
jgi:hypothetical protein